MTTVAYAVLGLAVVLYVARFLRPRTTLPDRVVALDSLLVTVVGLLAVLTADTGRADFAGVLLVVAVLAFLGTVTVARYIERRGA